MSQGRPPTPPGSFANPVPFRLSALDVLRPYAVACFAASAASASGPGSSADGSQGHAIDAAEDAFKEDSAMEMEELSMAVQASEAEAVEAHNAELAKALSLSKLDRGNLSEEQVVVLRLSRRNAEVEETLLHAVELHDLHERLAAAGCRMVPEWAGGAIFLVPLTQDMIIEADIDDLRPHHVVALQIDVDRLKSALAEVPSRRRPTVKGSLGNPMPTQPDEETDHRSSLAGSSEDLPIQSGAEPHGMQTVSFIVERTFVACPEPKVVSEHSQMAQSAPSCIPSGDYRMDSRNPRRWGSSLEAHCSPPS